MEFKVTTDDKGWLQFARKKTQQVAGAALGAMRDTAINAVNAARDRMKTIIEERKYRNPIIENLKEGLRLFFTGKTGEVRPRAIIFHRSEMAAKLEHGGFIEGRPLLWIPTTRGAPTASKSGKNLTSATVRGRPLLFDADDRDPHRRPLYIGVSRVRVPKLTDTIGVIKDRLRGIHEAFRERFRGD